MTTHRGFRRDVLGRFAIPGEFLLTDLQYRHFPPDQSLTAEGTRECEAQQVNLNKKETVVDAGS
jgi:hypothetical protein